MTSNPFDPTPNPLERVSDEFLPNDESQALTKEILDSESTDPYVGETKEEIVRKPRFSDADMKEKGKKK